MPCGLFCTNSVRWNVITVGQTNRVVHEISRLGNDCSADCGSIIRGRTCSDEGNALADVVEDDQHTGRGPSPSQEFDADKSVIASRSRQPVTL